MAFEKSEYKDNFDPLETEAVYEYDRPLHRDNLYLASNIDQKDLDAQVNKAMMQSRATIDPSNAGVYSLLDPYVTTYNKEHRRWRPDEWNGIAKKNACTIFDTEEVPKGQFGTKTNPVSEVRDVDDRQHMNDDIWFKTRAKQRNVHCPLKIVPNRGALSETKEMFTMPTDVKAKNDRLCPVAFAAIQPETTKNVVFAVPGMYSTEYTNIGRGKPAATLTN